MSRAERRNPLINGARLRVARAVPAVLFVVALLLLANTLTLVLGGVGLDASLILAAPQIPAPPIGGSSIRPSIDQPAWVVYLVGVVGSLAAAVGGLLIVRRNRRVDRAQR